MLSSIVRLSLRRPWVVVALCLVLLAFGALALERSKLDLFPTLSPAFATIETEAPGLGAEQVEQLVTRSVENAVVGTPGVASVHSTSIPGRSVVTLQFEPQTDLARVRQAISERSGQVLAGLPAGVGAPRLSPSTSGGGDILKIGFTSTGLTPMALRTLVQWTVRPQLLSAPGVADVDVYGGEVRRIEVRARAGDLSDSDLGYADVYDAVRRATGVAGAGFIDTPAQRVLIDPHGQALTADDVAAGQIQVVGSAPTRISDVADVVDAASPQVGDALIMGRAAVIARVRAQYSADTLDTTRAIDARLALLRPTLARQGVSLDATLDRPASFITRAVDDLRLDLALGGALAAILLILALRDWRGALVALVSVPLSLCAALIALRLLGWTLNTMTLGGLVVAVGLVVDDAVIDLDHLLTRLRDAEFHHASRRDALLRATLEVRAPVVFAAGLIVIGLAPVFLINGVAGALLKPLAAVIIIATSASLAVTLAVTPALALLFLGHVGPEREPALLHRLKVGYDAVLARVIGIGAGWVYLATGLLILVALFAFSTFRAEFLPKFHSGHLIANVSGPASTSIAAMRDAGGRMTHDLLALPQVVKVSQQTGRAETGNDPSGPEQAQFDIELRPGMSDAAQDAAERKVRAVFEAYPGFHPEVKTRLGDQILGPSRRGEIEVRIYGDDLDGLDAAAARVTAAIRGLTGVGHLVAPTLAAAPSVRIDLNFQRLAIYGLSAADVLDTVQTAFEGRRAAQVYENGRAIDIAVTAQAGLRRDPEAAGELLLRSSSGVSAPLSTVANVYLSQTRGAIEHDDGLRRQSVFVDGVGDSRSFIRKAQARIASAVVLPPGLFIDFVTSNSGDIDRSALVLGATLAVFGMLVLLGIAFGSIRTGILVLGSTAFSFVGGIAIVALTGGVLTLGAIIGFIALFGLSTRAAVLLISRIEDLVIERRRPWSPETARLAARQRLWPIVTSALVVTAALSPLVVRAGQPGMEILGPMAWVVLGGLLSSALLDLLLLPSLALAMWRPRSRSEPEDPRSQ